jgi:mono/diheme cytochrome c family protein
MIRRTSLFIGLVGLSLGACRGEVSHEPPIHLNQNMDQQNRFEMQEANPFFPDGASDRPLPLGVVAYGGAKADDVLYRGKTKEGGWAMTLPDKDEDGQPMVLSRAFLQRGKTRFEVYCAPCHDAAGTGQGIVVQRGMFPPPSLNDDRVLAMPIGQLYDAIASGVRNMPSYSAQIPVRDRWAVAAYVRTLQLSKHATLERIPADQAAAQGWGLP